LSENQTFLVHDIFRESDTLKKIIMSEFGVLFRCWTKLVEICDLLVFMLVSSTSIEFSVREI